MADVLVTVIGPRRGEDLRLPAEVPVVQLLPALVSHCIGPEGANGTEWVMGPLGQPPFKPEDSLADQGVLDGAVLYLRDRDAGDGTSLQAPPDLPAVAPGVSLLERTRALLPAHLTRRQRLSRALGYLGRPAGQAAASGGGRAGGNGSPGLAPSPGTATLAGMEWEPAPLAGDDGGPSPAALTVPERLPARRRAQLAWDASDYLTQLNLAIAGPRLRRCVTIAVVSPKGGVGKTTVCALLGTILALVRRDRVVAVDTNPDFGSLGRVLAPGHTRFVDDLVDVLERPDLGATELDAALARGAHGLMVLPAPTDPARMERLDEATYLRVIRRLQAFAGVVLLDCGTGLQEPAARAALATSDQLLLVSDAEPATASLVAEAGIRLGITGQPLTLVVNKAAQSSRLDLERLGSYLPQAVGAILFDEEAEAASRLTGAQFSWRDAPESWQRAGRELAALLAVQWEGLGLAL